MGVSFAPGDALTFAWERLKAQPAEIALPLLAGSFLCVVINAIISSIFRAVGGTIFGISSHRGTGGLGFDFMSPVALGFTGTSQIVGTVVGSFFLAGLTHFSLKVARGATFEFGDIFAGAPFFVSVLVANLISSAAIVCGACFFIVPGVIVAVGLSMAGLLIVDKGLGPIEALKASWDLTTGHKVNLFVLWLLNGALAIGALCTCGLAFFVLAPMMWLQLAYVYLRLTGQNIAPPNRTI